MKQLKELLVEFEDALIKAQCPILKKLKAGHDAVFVKELLNRWNIQNGGLTTLYSWKNGLMNMADSVIGEIELFPNGSMLPLEEAEEVYNIYTQEESYWDKNLFPIFTNGGGDYLLYDVDNKSPTYEMIFLYAPSLLLDEKPQTKYDSLESLIETQIQCLNNDSYNFDSKGIYDIDYDLLYEISAKHNPKSKYWDEYR
ncbi:MAG TPA: SMI1/KNR4 family protein [Chitinophagaceae bacterium]|nr:SMI1/KNR4 family protein [Chitinophagaceae bacterium]